MALNVGQDGTVRIVPPGTAAKVYAVAALVMPTVARYMCPRTLRPKTVKVPTTATTTTT